MATLSTQPGFISETSSSLSHSRLCDTRVAMATVSSAATGTAIFHDFPCVSEINKCIQIARDVLFPNAYSVRHRVIRRASVETLRSDPFGLLDSVQRRLHLCDAIVKAKLSVWYFVYCLIARVQCTVRVVRFSELLFTPSFKCSHYRLKGTIARIDFYDRAYRYSVTLAVTNAA